MSGRGNFFLMKKWYLLFLTTISINLAYGQARFFEFVEGWQAATAVEYDTHYVVIGAGSQYVPFYKKYIQFSSLDKFGNSISFWTYSIDSTFSTDMRNAQLLSIYSEKPTIGITIETNPEQLLIAKRLTLSNDLTEIIDSSWVYPSQNESIMLGTLQPNDDNILHAASFFDTKIKSTLLQTDTLGNIEWEEIFSCSGYCDMEPRHIIPAHDNGYLFTNEEKRRVVPGGGPGDHNVATIIKVDSLGNQEWRIYPGGTGFPYTSDYILVTPTDDGNYLCAWADNELRMGNLNIAYNSNPDVTIWFAKINEQGQKIWEKNIQQDIDLWGIGEVRYRLTQMKKIADGNIVLVGLDKMIKITQDAEVIWARNLKPDFLQNPSDPESYLYIKGLTPTTDDGFICAGQANIYPGSVFPQFTQTGFVIKLDEYGCLEPDCHLNDPVSTTTTSANYAELKLFPNPAQDYINIEYSTTKSPKFIAVNITDLAGRVVYAQVLENQEQYLTISTKDLPSGQYFCQLFIDGSMGATRKFVLVK